VDVKPILSTTVVITHPCANFDYKKFARRLLNTIVGLHVHKVLTTVFKIIRLKFHEILFFRLSDNICKIIIFKKVLPKNIT
jgi:hypothetical protein